MLVISDTQMAVFREKSLERFETDMLSYFASDFAPVLFQTVGEAAFGKAIAAGIDAGAEYGFTRRGPVRLYLELRPLLGARFDTDPQYAWAQEILEGSDEDTQMHCADDLYTAAMEYFEEAAGVNDTYAIDALKRIIEFIHQCPVSSQTDFIVSTLRRLEGLHPKKVSFVGNEGMVGLVLAGLNEALEGGFDTPRDATLIIITMFVFGHGCFHDPLYPCIANSLRNPHAGQFYYEGDSEGRAC